MTTIAIFDLASFLLRHHRKSRSAGRDEEYSNICGWFGEVTMKIRKEKTREDKRRKGKKIEEKRMKEKKRERDGKESKEGY